MPRWVFGCAVGNPKKLSLFGVLRPPKPPLLKLFVKPPKTPKPKLMPNGSAAVCIMLGGSKVGDYAALLRSC